ncbi:MAG TPA: aldehyde dehydrogenase family protein [Candidatus Paceibacterota bacterium]
MEEALMDYEIGGQLNIMQRLGIKAVNSGVCNGFWFVNSSGEELVSVNPATGGVIARVTQANQNNYEWVVNLAQKKFKTWRMMPAPKRGEIVRQIGEELRKFKKELGALVSLEMGKIIPEGEGEVQEMIDICDFAAGLSRQLYGLTMHSERTGHRMYEQWHPLGHVGIITAFNFPVAVWAWNAAIAAVCGNTMVWKPSSETPLCAIAVQNICNRVLKKHNLQGVFNLIIGSGNIVGEALIKDKRLPLISATGSCEVGRHIAETVSKRFGRALLELGGNNAVVVLNDANLDLAIRAILFGAIGTSGQRCTTIRRLIVQKEVAEKLTGRLMSAYRQITIGDPLNPKTLMGPLVNKKAVNNMFDAIETIKLQGGEIIYGGIREKDKLNNGGFFVEPTIVKAHKAMPIIQEEIFAPILYIIEANDLEEAIEVNNNVPQGLSSAIFTNSLISAETFLSHRGSDCGIANINIGTSGAEIGGAFGGEKETGGGREAGSDSWKAYMRRQTCTINWSHDLPLAQGIKFGG